MANSDTWNTAFEAIPADGDDINEGADRIRDTKLGIRERMEKDHYMAVAGTDADHGEHKQVTLRKLAAAPGNVADKAFLYIKDVGDGVMELFFEDEAGNEIQITSGTALGAAFPSGTKLPFYQDAAPSGWTIQTGLNDKLLFITKGSVAGGLAGGIVHATGTWTQPDHTHKYTDVIAHTHTLELDKNRTKDEMYGGKLGTGPPKSDTYNATTASTGVAEGTTQGEATVNTWRPAAYNVIICAKD